MKKEHPYAWVLLGVLWIFTFLSSIARFIQSFYQPEMSSAMGVSRGFLSATWSVGILISAVCAPIGGLLVDRWGYKKVMVHSGILGCVSTFVVLLFQGPLGYFIGFGILAGLAGIGSSAGYVMITNWFKYHRAKALMLIGCAASLGLAALTPLLVHYRDWANWVKLYWILFIVSVISVIFTMLFIRSNQEEEAESPKEGAPAAVQAVKIKLLIDVKEGLVNFKNYCKNPVIAIIMVALFSCGFNMGTVERHLMAIHQVAHVHDAMFISSLSLLGLLEVAGGLLFSFLLDHMNRLIALAILYLIRIVAFVFLFLHLEISPILFSVIFGASYLGAIPGGILVATESIEKQGKSIGLQVGVLLLIHQLGGVVAGYAGGLNYDIFLNYQLLIFVDIVLVVFSALAYLHINRKKTVFAATDKNAVPSVQE